MKEISIYGLGGEHNEIDFMYEIEPSIQYCLEKKDVRLFELRGCCTVSAYEYLNSSESTRGSPEPNFGAHIVLQSTLVIRYFHA